jgi:hypothetical protein
MRLLVLTLLLAGTAVHAKDVAQPKKQVREKIAVSSYDHLRYFGFYASAMGHWNFTEELAPFTNLTWIHLGVASDPAAAIGDIVFRLQQAQDAGVQGVLSIDPFLFQDRKGTPRDDLAILDLLLELRGQIESAGLVDTVAMIYPKDEPFREFVRNRDPSYIDQYVTGAVYADIHADLVHVNGLVKSVFPEKPIGVILSGHELHHAFFSIPENYDWVGFDCYSDMFRGCDGNRTIVDHYERLLAYMQPHQRLMAVPEAWARTKKISEPDWPEVLLSRFRHHYEIALSEPRFIAFIPFIWSFEADNEVPGVGLDRFEALYDDGFHNPGARLVNEAMATGFQVKHGLHQYPNLEWAETEDTQYRPAQAFRGGITGISREGQVTAWAVNDALPHKNLRYQVRLRDARGILRHKSPVLRTGVVDHGRGVGTTVGLHGIRYTLPTRPFYRNLYRSMTVELLIFADGPVMKVARIEKARFTPGLKADSAIR